MSGWGEPSRRTPRVRRCVAERSPLGRTGSVSVGQRSRTGRCPRGGRRPGSCALLLALAFGCKPVELSLFDPPTPDAGSPSIQEPPEEPRAEPDAAEPEAVAQPPCVDTSAQSACELCRAQGLCGPGEICHPNTGRCAVACTENEECAAPDVCSRRLSICTECDDSSQCGGARPACNVELGRCVQCTDEAHCGGLTPACALATGQCVECVDDSNCLDPDAPACDPRALSCVQCLVGDVDYCATVSGRPYCDPDFSRCEECFLDQHCPGAECDIERDPGERNHCEDED